MDKRMKAIAAYKIFGSPLRGTEEVEKMVAAVISERETDENLSLFASALSIEWRYTDENVSTLKEAFSDFEDRPENKKSELIRSFSVGKEKIQKVRRTRNMAFKS